MNITEQIAQLEQEKVSLNPNDASDKFKIQTIDMRIAELRQQASGEQPQGVSQKHNLPVDFNEMFGTTLLNHTIQALLDEQYLRLQTDFETRLEERESQLRDKDLQLEAARGQVQLLIDEKSQAVLERNDFEARWKNAATIIEEKDAELAGKELLLSEKQAQIEQLRVELANSAAPKPAIDITPTNLDFNALREQRAAELAAKPKIWDVKPIDFKGSVYEAVDEKGDRIEVKHLELGRYNVQEGPFRPMDANVGEKPLEQSSSVETGSSFPGAVTTPTIPAVNPPAIYAGSQASSIGLQMAAGESGREAQGTDPRTVTREEFEALKLRVDAIEAGKVQVA